MNFPRRVVELTLAFTNKIYFFGFVRKNISPAMIIPAPINCIYVSFSPSNIPQIMATIGIIKVTVEAKRGDETFNKR